MSTDDFHRELSEALNTEIQSEEDYQPPPQLSELENNLFFEIDENTMPGEMTTSLVRSNEKEIVEVVFNADDIIEIENSDTEATAAVPFQVTVAKVNTEDRVLRFKCHATEDGDITINRVGVEHDVDTSGIAEMLEGVDVDEEKANAQDGHGIHHEGSTSDNEDYQEHAVEGDYEGPVFTDLDENLQYQFSCYLERQGIDANFATYAVVASQHKEQMAYINWLCEVDDFIRADDIDDDDGNNKP
jgi:hypothetical protein